jgi:hypothetical protein
MMNLMDAQHLSSETEKMLTSWPLRIVSNYQEMPTDADR